MEKTKGKQGRHKLEEGVYALTIGVTVPPSLAERLDQYINSLRPRPRSKSSLIRSWIECSMEAGIGEVEKKREFNLGELHPALLQLAESFHTDPEILLVSIVEDWLTAHNFQKLKKAK